MKQSVLTFLASLAALLLGLSCLVGATAFAQVRSLPLPCVVERCGGQASELPVATVTRAFPVLTARPTPEFLNTFTASATYALDDETGVVLWDVSSTLVRPLASITKLMTALVLTELPVSWEATTTITEADSDGSNTHLKVGETYSLKTLWQVALIGSSNTAISALVRMSGVTSENFVERMNAKARRLNMPTLHFFEPTGLDPRNVGTAQDIARLLRFALKNEAIRPVLERSSITLYPPLEKKPRIVWSTNWLLTKWIPNSFVGLSVGKTGYIGDAGYNFAVRVVNSAGHALRIVVLGAGAPESRFTEAKSIGEWVFKHTAWPEPISIQSALPHSTSSVPSLP